MRSGTRPNSYWGTTIRERIASQLQAVRHWEILYGDYNSAPDIEATWFIDPPYEIAGKLYRHGSDDIDYKALGDWCRSLRGQVMVCENVGASWLPFVPFMTAKSTPGKRGKSKSAEAIWLNDTGESP